MPDVFSRAARKVRSVYGAAHYHGKTAVAPIARSARRLLIEAGVPLRKRFLVLPCMTGQDTSGLFTEFLAALGALAQHERWPSLYAGLRIDYADQGLYYDPSVGPNWWEYYFEPIDLGSRDHAAVRTIDPHEHDILTYQAAAMPRDTAAGLISRYVHLNPHIRETVEAYLAAHFQHAFVIGVHYRGTNKHEEAPAVAYPDVAAAVRETAGSVDGYRVFLATDEQAFLDYMREQFPGRLLYRPMFRSIDGRPIDEINDDGNWMKGADAVIDCVLLSKTHRLIRTASNLSLCSAFFNPEVPDLLLNRPYYTPG